MVLRPWLRGVTGVQVLAPTLLEYGAARWVLPRSTVTWTGMRLSHWKGFEANSPVLLCGLAGALTPDLAPGTVLIPEQVGLPDGQWFRCDPAMVARLRRAAERLGFIPECGPLLTAPGLVTGTERQVWARHGFVAVDMETALPAARGACVATVRVILDTPGRELGSEWQQPAMALLRPALWRQIFWLARTAPRYAHRAARVVKEGLESPRQ